MSLFGKKKDEKEMVKEQSGCCCGGNCNEESVEAAKETLSSGANVKVLGGGCDKCNALEKNVKEALSELGMTDEIDHVTDFGQIAAMGVMSTPALVIDNKVVSMGKVFASDVFESYSAGTETKPQINQDAVRIMKEMYGIDMEKEQYSKLISDIPEPDIAISMGCNVGCPFIGRPFDDNWGLDDPTGKSDEDFIKVINQIELKIKNMIDRMK